MHTSLLPRAFSHLAWSNLGAQSAEQLSLAAAPLFAVLALGAGPGEIGTLTAFQTLPFLLLSLPLGVLADRLPRRRLMLWSETLRCLALLSVLLMLYSGALDIVWMAALGFAGAVGTVGFSVATPGLVALLVPRAALAQANARLELARSVAFAGGPAVAGALVSWAGATAAFAVATVLSASALAQLLQLQLPRAATVGTSMRKRHPLREVAEGATFVWRNRLLRPIMMTGVIFNLSSFALQAVYVPYAIRVLGLGTGAVGLTLALFGAGMMVGALAAAPIVARLSLGRAIQIGPIAGVLAAFSLAATLAMPSAAPAGLCFFLLGAGPMVWTITTTTLRQSMTPDTLLGRVSAVFLTANAGARPVGAALGGLVGSTWGDAACLLMVLTGFILQAVVILASRVGQLRELPAAHDDPDTSMERAILDDFEQR